jgi:crotonobetainyl-CoA:carnitine CoA-transferase CaiB-like acyl-CoA transferase
MTTSLLSGITVLDFSGYIAGPCGAALLGDMGASVIKIEVPAGDPMRHYPSSLPDESRAFLGVNRNKIGITLDLKSASGQEICQRLIKKTDVIIHNFRASAALRLKLDFDSVLALNDQIVYGSLTGYGTEGPMAPHPGFDQVLQSMTGIAHAQGASIGQPTSVVGSIVDYYGGSMLALGISAALFNRDRTKQAQLIETSLLRSALAMQAGRLVWADGEAKDVERDLKPGKLAGIHPTKEGFIYIQAQTPKFWLSLCDCLGVSQLADDPRFGDMVNRKNNEDALIPIIHEALSQRTALEWEESLAGRVPCTVVRRVDDMFDHPQVAAEQIIVKHEHPGLGGYRAFAGPLVHNAHNDITNERRAPLLGEHNEEVIMDLGLSAEQIQAAHDDGAFG